MKTLKYTILLAAALAVAGNCAEAQITVSNRQSYSNSNGTRVIERVYGSNELVFYYDKTTHKNVFLFPWTKSSGTVNKFSFPDESGPQGSFYYTINDIVVIGEMCYFCGKKKFENGYEYDLNNIPHVVFDSVGFVGRFSLSNVTSFMGSSLKYQVRTLDGTVNILRMDKHTDINSDTLLAMVGVTNDLTNGVARTTCLVFMHGAGSSWHYNVRKSSNDSETFTDIVFTDKYVVAVSKLQGDSLKFCLRGGSLHDVYGSDDYSALDDMNQFNTSNMYVYSLGSLTPTWHYDNVQMKLCSIPATDQFHVAYETFFPNPIYGVTQNNVSVFQMDASLMPSNQNRIYMNLAQFVRNSISDTGTFADIALVPYTSSTALLHRTTNGSLKSILQIASWSPIGTVKSYTSSTETLKSIDVMDGRHVYGAGHAPGSNDNIVGFYQDANNFSTTCYDTTSHSAYPLYPVVTSAMATSTLIEHRNNDDLPWPSGGVQVNGTSIARGFPCTKVVYIIGPIINK